MIGEMLNFNYQIERPNLYYGVLKWNDNALDRSVLNYQILDYLGKKF